MTGRDSSSSSTQEGCQCQQTHCCPYTLQHSGITYARGIVWRVPVCLSRQQTFTTTFA
jgi:hypothetical protein